MTTRRRRVAACATLALATLAFHAAALAPPLLAGVGSGPFVQVEAGTGYLALRSDGSVVRWGWNYYEEAPSLPAGQTYVEIAEGGSFSMARRSDGSVVVLGAAAGGPVGDVPALPPGMTYVEIAAGPHHALARRSDGSVVAWGDNSSGACDVPALPPGLTYVQISAGGYGESIWDLYEYCGGGSYGWVASHSVALRSDGSVVAWGDGAYGQTSVPPLPPGLTYVEVSAGGAHTVARLSDGSVVAFGLASLGQLDVPSLPPGVTFTGIDAGGGGAVARLSDGSFVTWGAQWVQSPMAPWSLPAPPAGTTYGEVSVGGGLQLYSYLDENCWPVGSSPEWTIVAVALLDDGSLSDWTCTVGGTQVSDLGHGLAGSTGVPVLTGVLQCNGAWPANAYFWLQLAHALPNSSSTLVLGFSNLGMPFKGGTLVPTPDVLVPGLPIKSNGALYLNGTFSTAGIPSGLVIHAQHWIVDPAGPQGFAASNGLSFTTP